MATFVAKNSGGVKKEANDNLKRVFFFFGFSFSFIKRRQRLAGVRGFSLKYENNLRFS